MGFNRPSDLAIIFGIFAVIVITGYFGIESINFYTNQTVNDTDFFVSVRNNATGEKGLKGSADDATGALEGISTQENLIVQGYESLRDLGKIFISSEQALQEGAREIGIDQVYITIIVAILLIVFIVVLWTWVTGGGS